MLWTCLCYFFKFVVLIFISTESDHSQALSVTHSVTAGFVETFPDISYMAPTWVGCSTIIYNYNQWPLERVVARSRFQISMAEWFYGAFLCIELTHDFKSKIRPWAYGQILTWSLTIFGPFLQGKNGQNKPENQQNWNMAKSAPKSDKFMK